MLTQIRGRLLFSACTRYGSVGDAAVLYVFDDYAARWNGARSPGAGKDSIQQCAYPSNEEGELGNLNIKALCMQQYNYSHIVWCKSV